MAVRLALGASRARLVRQLLVEAGLLSLVAGGLGLVVAAAAVRALMAFKPPVPIPISLDLGIDSRVLAFTCGISSLSALFFGLAPAVHGSRPDVLPTLKDESGRWGRRYRRFGFRNLLVVAQVAVSLLLLIGAGLFLRSLAKAQSRASSSVTRW
jgi:hypothetical protein